MYVYVILNISYYFFPNLDIDPLCLDPQRDMRAGDQNCDISADARIRLLHADLPPAYFHTQPRSLVPREEMGTTHILAAVCLLFSAIHWDGAHVQGANREVD